jgi:hypothetical protein
MTIHFRQHMPITKSSTPCLLFHDEHSRFITPILAPMLGLATAKSCANIHTVHTLYIHTAQAPVACVRERFWPPRNAPGIAQLQPRTGSHGDGCKGGDGSQLATLADKSSHNSWDCDKEEAKRSEPRASTVKRVSRSKNPE